MSWPTLEIVPVALPTLPGHDLELWAALIELASLRPGEWSLVGGQMVFLHAMEHGVTPPRVSTDLDVLVNARVVAGGVRQFVLAIEGIGFELDGVSPEGLAHRYRRHAVSIDVLAPEGLGRRADLRTTPPGRTLQVPGGTQALLRTELLPVRVGGVTGMIPLSVVTGGDREQGCRSPSRRCAGGATPRPSVVAVSCCRSAGNVGPDDCEGP